ncbi:Hypothetical predicted protein, partial [Paramuricea clavata]
MSSGEESVIDRQLMDLDESMRDLFDVGVLATWAISGEPRQFPVSMKNGQQWAKKQKRG